MLLAVISFRVLAIACTIITKQLSVFGTSLSAEVRMKFRNMVLVTFELGLGGYVSDILCIRVRPPEPDRLGSARMQSPDAMLAVEHHPMKNFTLPEWEWHTITNVYGGTE
jgi:hypothetical protein